MSRLPITLASLSLLSLAAIACGQSGNPFEQGGAKPANPFEQNGTTPGNPFDQAPKPAPAAASAPVVMRVQTFNDPKSGDMPSHTILVPEGWQAEGGAFWADPQRFFKWLPSQNIRVSAPDGRMVYLEPSLWATHYRPSPQAMQLNVQLPVEGQPSNGLITLAMPESPEAWAALIGRAIANEYPNATGLRLDPVERAAELDGQMQKVLAPIRQMQQQTNAMMTHVRGFAEGGGYSVLAHYTIDGKAYDHLVVWAFIALGSETQFGVERKWWIEPAVHYRAPAGRLTLELPMMMAVAQSMKPTPEWAKMKADLARRMHQLEGEAIRQNGEMMAESQRQFAAQQRSLHAQRMNDIAAKGQQIAARGRQLAEMYNTTNANSGNDKGHESFIKAMREVTDYKASDDSGAPSVQLPSHYDHVYGNSRGEFILTNDGNFNPNLDPTFNAAGRRWGAMQPIE